ncbi:hypothetical protein [Coxiella-like endosymbiont of Rhipicephalus sanguineus]|uniref:hypothetical protein n=1 Tax=Coxiella-like endosymbiont of Rhipicephalus sanguineus TaxID=1955402 RepID=UPI0020407BD2|nr:hypothetical protein [Coxiella-like endosymbiont of Rhipicephalus sanguineus]
MLNLATSEWMDKNGLTWLAAAPKIRLLKENDKREPYPLNLVEQDRLFTALPLHLQGMALFKVNTGCCEQEVYRLRWEWDYPTAVHDLKHTFGRRLRAAGVMLEDRQDLLGHKSDRITTHYSIAEIKNFIETANKAYHNQTRTLTLTLLHYQPKIRTIFPPEMLKYFR